MGAALPIMTPRLLLREWEDADRAPFHAMSIDPEVMAYLGPLMTRAESDAVIDRKIATQAAQGVCFWAIIDRESGDFVGSCGLKHGPDDTPLEGRIEIGWRIARHYWGKGIACEAARAALDHGWTHLNAPSIGAMTVAANVRSWGLMERLGMRRRPELDFVHPAMPKDSPLNPHIIYTIDRPKDRS